MNAQIAEQSQHPFYVKTFDADGQHITTIDTRTGLEWLARDLGRFTNKAKDSAAEKACRECRVGGHDDWRMPTVEELFPLADRSKVSPAIDTEFFPDCPSEWFWTSTPDAESPSDCAWFVSFSDGYSGYDGRGYYGRVRAVRRASRQFSASLASESEQA